MVEGGTQDDWYVPSISHIVQDFGFEGIVRMKLHIEWYEERWPSRLWALEPVTEHLLLPFFLIIKILLSKIFDLATHLKICLYIR